MIEWIIFLAVLSVILFLLYLRDRRSVRSHTDVQQQHIHQIREFLQDPTSAHYSLSDDKGAPLQNAIAQLEEHALQAENRLKQERTRNAGFVADISHQLKTPLAALRLYTELTDHEYSDKELLLIERMEDLIFHLLRLEKLRAGAYELSFEALDLRTLVLDAWDDLHTLFPDRTLHITGDATQRCDAFWMREAVRNILQNACEQPADNPEIHVNIRNNPATTSITLEDHGGGVDSAKLGTLFDRFSHSQADVQMGKTGLGLAITQAVVQQHHGTIFADNTLTGLRITIFLPILEGYKRWN